MLSLCCYAWVFSSCREWGFLSSSGMQAAHCGASVAAALRLRSTGPTAVAHGLSCCAASGIFLDQGSNSCLLSEGSNSCLLHWQADSLPLSHQGNPCSSFLTCLFTYRLSDAPTYTQDTALHTRVLPEISLWFTGERGQMLAKKQKQKQKNPPKEKAIICICK